MSDIYTFGAVLNDPDLFYLSVDKINLTIAENYEFKLTRYQRNRLLTDCLGQRHARSNYEALASSVKDVLKSMDLEYPYDDALLFDEFDSRYGNKLRQTLDFEKLIDSPDWYHN